MRFNLKKTSSAVGSSAGGGKKGKLRRRLLLALALILVAGAAAFFVLRPQRQPAAVEASTVQSATAETGTISSTVSATGSLALSDTTDVTMPTGLLVEEVCVEAGDEVKKGDTLAKLSLTSVVSALIDANDSLDDIEDQLDDDDDLSTLEKELLNSEKSDLEEEISTLEALHDNPVITATCNGIVGSVNVSENAESSVSSGTTSGSSAASTSALLSGTSADVSLDGGAVTLLGSTKTQSAFSLLSSSSGDSSASSDASLSTASETEDSSAASSGEDSGEDSGSSDGDTTSNTAITDYSAFSVAAPVTGETPQSEIAETSSYTGTISWNCTGVFQADTAYTATITLKARDGYVFTSEELPSISGASYDWSINEKGNRLFLKVTFEKTGAAATNPDAVDPNTSDSTTTLPSSGTGSLSGFGSSGSISGFSSGSVASGSSSSGSSSTSSVYSSYETVAFTIQKQDKAVISVSIDELDILSLEKGQSATVTLDAIEGETFTGTITSISNEGTSSGGSAKYTVEVTVDLDDQMRSGMSASVVIETGSTENAVLIPVSALQESGDSTFVYTETDEEGNLSGKVEVTTGLSDSTNVEITSGLSAGDTVYYTRTLSDSTDSSGFTVEGFEGGGMPSGGDMPSGGGPSGGQGGQPS